MQCCEIIKNQIEKHLATLYIPEIESGLNTYSSKKNIKNQILDCIHIIDFPNETLAFNVTMHSDAFKEAIFSEISSEFPRIQEQMQNVDHLIKSNAQPAWILVTTYYACFFIANLVNRLMGRTSINFHAEQIKKIFLADSSPPLQTALQQKLREISVGKNFNYTCVIQRGDIQNELKLRFIPGGDRPHEAVWSNFFQNLNSLNKEIPELTLLKNIVNISHSKFPIPNKLRNEWNYSDQKYYSNLGTQTAEKFIKIINNSKALSSWITIESTTLRQQVTDEANQICSLAFLYNVLKKTYNQTFLPEQQKATPVTNNLSRKKKNLKRKFK